jgi:PKD repeat protein
VTQRRLFPSTLRLTLLAVFVAVHAPAQPVFKALPDANPRSGLAPLTVTFTSNAQIDSGVIVTYRWDFQGDGIFDVSEPGPRSYTFTFTKAGTYNAVLEVVNDQGQTARASIAITVMNSPPSATAFASPTNGPGPLTVQFTASAKGISGTITKYEWDFNGSGKYTYSSATTGNTSFIYTSKGTYTAALRVTDDQGSTTVVSGNSTTVRVGATGTPTSVITAPKPPVTATAPATISFDGMGRVGQLGNQIVRYQWDFGDGSNPYSSTTSAATTHTYASPGLYTAKLDVTDNKNQTATDEIDINLMFSATMSISTDTLNPARGDTVALVSTISSDVPVSVLMADQSGQIVRTLAGNQPRKAGKYSDPWDGRDDKGNLVLGGVYYALLQYTMNGQVQTIDPSRTTGGVLTIPPWRMGTVKGGSCNTCNFTPLNNDFLKVDFDLSRASQVSVTLREFFSLAQIYSVFDKHLFGRGTHTVYWDGTGADGNYLFPPAGRQFLWAMAAYTLADNAIFVDRNPEVTDLAVSPNYFDPSTGDFISPQNPTTKLTYTLTADATVQVQVYSQKTNQLVRTVWNAPATAGTQTASWDGRNDAGVFMDTGTYRIAVKAVDANGNSSLVRYGYVKVFY